MATLNGKAAALLIVDVQRGFDEIEAAGARRNNPDAVERIAALLAAFRAAGGAVFHVRHASREPDSPFRPERSGYAVKDEARERAGEPVIVKHVNAAFIGTDLDERLRRDGIEALVVVGVTTNHCVETTTRMAGNLGYDTWLVSDATWTFDRTGIDGRVIRAADIQHMTLSNLSGEFATIASADDVIARLGT